MAFQKTAIRIVWQSCITLFFLLIPLLGWTQHVEEPTVKDILHKADSLRYHAQFDSSNHYYRKAAAFADKSDFKTRREVLFQLSLNYTDQGQPDSTAELLEQAHTISQKHDPDDSIFNLRYFHQKGILAKVGGNYQKALDWFKKGLQRAESLENISFIVKMNTGIGEVYTSQGKYGKAIELFSKAQNDYHRHRLEDEKLLSRIYNGRGNAHQKKGEYKTAQKYFDRALEIDKGWLPHPHPDLSKRFNNLALIYYYQSDYQRALDYMINATEILSSFYGENHRLVAAGFNNVGIVYSEIGKFEQAADYLEKSLYIKEKVLGDDHLEVGIGYKNLGAIYSDMEQYNDAITFYHRSEQVLKQQFPNGHPRLADIYANLGKAYSQKKSYKEALNFYFKDLEINRRMLAEDHPYIGDTYAKIGETYAEIENFSGALNYYNRAMEVLVNNYNTDESLETFSLEHTAYPELLLTTLQLKAETLYQYGKQSNNRQPLDQALKTYQQAVDFINELQQSLTRDKSKFLLRERTVNFYEKGFKTAYDLLQTTGNPDYKHHLFYFVQKSRNQILLEHIQQLDNQQFSRIPDSLITREKALKEAVTNLQQQLFNLTSHEQNQDSLKRLSLQDSLFHTQERLQTHIQTLETEYPKYYGLKYESPTINVSEIQEQLLSPNQTLLSYFRGSQSLFAFIITRDSYYIKEVTSDTLLNKKVMDYRESILESASPESFAKQSHELYRLLIEPISDLISGHRLLIIPDGPLHYLPFESLVSQTVPSTGNKRFYNLPYLVNNYTISYASSVGYLKIQNRQKSPNHKKTIAAFAPKYENRSTSNKPDIYPGYNGPVSPLLFNKREVQKLEELFNNSGGLLSFLRSPGNNVDILVDQEATETAFKTSNLKNYRYIHLATHAFLNEEQPDRSGILFSTPDSTEDGTLYANEIYNLELDADLITLSACKTGIGPIAKGEGIIGLSRAFQFAGARNLLVTLWEINDRSTERLIVDFYSESKDGSPMSAALQQAKLQIINHTEYAHPKYWAPFVFIGK